MQSDDPVVTFIKENEEMFFNIGVNQIIGLRDMYSEKYKKRSNEVNEDINKLFIEGAQKEINNCKHKEHIKIFFSIMEVESWLLSMQNVFTKIDPRLTPSYIKNFAKIDIKVDNLEAILKPSSCVINIFNSIGRKYNKHEDDTNMFISNMDLNDITMARNRSQSFKDFYMEIEKIKEQSPFT